MTSIPLDALQGSMPHDAVAVPELARSLGYTPQAIHSLIKRLDVPYWEFKNTYFVRPADILPHLLPRPGKQAAEQM